jgi:CcmD family protein
MHKKISFFLTTFLVLLMNGLSAQGVDMATGMRSEGKIYVVVVVVLIIFIGLAIYLFSLDKKLDKLEKNNPK